MTDEAISFREGGVGFDTRGRLKGRSWPWVGYLLRERRLGLGVQQVRDVIMGSGTGVGDLKRVAGVWSIEIGGMVSVKVVCIGRMAGGGRGLVTGRRCGRGG